jgi:2-iminobutanoate/2-iminopropanoate deaminase
MAKETIRTAEVKHGGGPYSQAVRAGGFVFVSGQTGVDSDGRMKQGIEAQTRQALRNAEAILRAAGATLKDVVQVRAYIEDLTNYGQMNKVYAEFFPEEPPSRACVSAKLPEGALVEFILTAHIG